MDLLFFAVFSKHFVLIKIKEKSAHESNSMGKNILMSENKQQSSFSWKHLN